MRAIWAVVLIDLRGVAAEQHVRIPVSVVRVTPDQAFLGLGA